MWSGHRWRLCKTLWGKITSLCGDRRPCRASPRPVVFPDDVETIRRDLEQGCKQLQGFHYQIVLRELRTLSGHPDRLHERTRAAIGMVHKHA